MMASRSDLFSAALLLLSLLLSPSAASAAPSPPPAPQNDALVLHGQAPFPLNAPIPASSADRLFLSAQTSNGVAVVDPFDAKLLGVVPLGGKLPETLGALYRGQSVVHGSGFSPDRRTVAAVCVGSDSVDFLDATGERDYGVLNITSVGRSPHEASWSPSGDEVWVAIRGENVVQVLTGGQPFAPLGTIDVPEGPGMVAFSPDGKLAFVCSSFTPETVVIDAATKEVVASIKQESVFCPNLAVTPDGEQLWFTLKDSGKTQVVEAKVPFRTIAVLDTGSVTNHVNFAVPPTAKENATPAATLAFVSIGAEGKILVFSTENVSFGSPPPRLLKTIQLPRGDDEPHAVWPSGDGARVWVGLQVANAAVAIDTRSLEVVEGSRVAIGAQSPMGMVYVPGAAANATGGKGVKKAKAAGAAAAGVSEATKKPAAFLSADKAVEESEAFHFELVSPRNATKVLTSLVVNQQSPFVDALEAVVAGLRPGESYALCLTSGEGEEQRSSGEKSPSLSPSSCDTVVVEFKGGKDGAASIATVGPFTDLLFEKKKEKSKEGKELQQRRFFVMAPRRKVGAGFGGAEQVQRQ